MNNRFAAHYVCIALAALAFSKVAIAVDATKSATEILHSGRWLLIEFAAREQLVYRVSAQSSNSKNFLSFDFAPSDNCVPLPAVMAAEFKAYNRTFDHGHVPMAFRSPGQNELIELITTEMARGDNFALFQFKLLTTQMLLKSYDRGSLSLWIPGSADGEVKRGNNIYFSLDGFTAAYEGALKRCRNNK